MTDFAKLVGSKGPVNDKLEAFEFKPEGFENGNGEPLSLMIHPAGGTRFKKAVRIMAIKMRKARGMTDEDADVEMTEAEIEAELEKTDENGSEILARCTDGWNLHSEGKALKFGLNACKELYIQVPELRELVDAEATKAGKKRKAKKTA